VEWWSGGVVEWWSGGVVDLPANRGRRRSRSLIVADQNRNAKKGSVKGMPKRGQSTIPDRFAKRMPREDGATSQNQSQGAMYGLVAAALLCNFRKGSVNNS
jgi:hypothetical protein